MPDLRKCVVWSVLFGLVLYVAYYQLQETTVSFTETVIIPAKRQDVSEQFLEQPQTVSDLHPYGTGVSNVQRTMSEEDPQKIKELRYILHERFFSLLWLIEIKGNLVLTLEFVEPDALVKTTSTSEFVMGFIKLKVDGTFLLADYKSKKESGTVLIDSRSFTGPRVVATQLFLAMGPPAHRKILNNLREFFVKK